MKNLLFISATTLFFACGNNQQATTNESTNTDTVNAQVTATPTEITTTADGPGITYTVDGTEINNYASVLVQKDKDIKQADAPFLCVLTSNAAKNNNEYIAINFLLNTKTGTYPVVGTSFQRGKSPNDQSFGAILGGTPKLTDYKVTIAECKDLGDNNMGGHKWSISGTCEMVIIKAMEIMLMDKSKGHPAEIKIEKISFKNLQFDDNWDEMMKKAMGK
jgi:hypothetical protein